MFPAEILRASLAAVVVVVLAPGPDHILAVSRGPSLGRAAATLASIGAAIGIMVHTLAVTAQRKSGVLRVGWLLAATPTLLTTC